MIKLNILFVPSWYPSRQNPVAGVFFEHQVEALKKKGVNVGIILPPIVINHLNKKNIIKGFLKNKQLLVENELLNKYNSRILT